MLLYPQQNPSGLLYCVCSLYDRIKHQWSVSLYAGIGTSEAYLVKGGLKRSEVKQVAGFDPIGSHVSFEAKAGICA